MKNQRYAIVQVDAKDIKEGDLFLDGSPAEIMKVVGVDIVDDRWRSICAVPIGGGRHRDYMGAADSPIAVLEEI